MVRNRFSPVGSLVRTQFPGSRLAPTCPKRGLWILVRAPPVRSAVDLPCAARRPANVVDRTSLSSWDLMVEDRWGVTQMPIRLVGGLISLEKESGTEERRQYRRLLP